MHRRTYLRRTATTVGAIGLAGCSGQDDGDQQEGADGTPTDTPTPTETATGTPTDTAGGTTVAMETEGSHYYFDPIGLYVEQGETVTWELESGTHSSTAYVDGTGGAETTRIPDGAEGWDSGTLSDQGATFEHTFETTGTYDYFCVPHKSLGMVGRIVVGDPGGPAEGSMPPDGEVPESSTIVEQGSVSRDEFGG